MPRDERMFGDVVDPSIKFGKQAGLFGSAVDRSSHTVVDRRDRHHSADGGRHPADAAVDDGVCGRRAAAAPPPPPPPPPPQRRTPQPVVDVNPNAAPIEAPKEIKPEVAHRHQLRARCRRRRRRAGRRRRWRRRRAAGSAAAAAPPPPAQPVRVGGHIKPPTQDQERAARSTRRSRSRRACRASSSSKPPLAPNGKVQDARCSGRFRCSTRRRIDAVRQWEFTPTLLNSVPVPVIMTVTVQFTLKLDRFGPARRLDDFLRMRRSAVMELEDASYRAGRSASSGAGVDRSAFAQEERPKRASLDIIEMFRTMGPTAWGVAIVLLIMSFWSVGVAIERIYTFSQARKQSKLYAPAGRQAPEGRPAEGSHRAVRRRRTTATATSPRSCSPVCRNTSSSRKAAAQPEPR